MSKPVILTGLRANNDLHIGNYLGALKSIVDLQRVFRGKYQINLFIPDLHSFTTPIKHDELQSQITHNLRLFVASGLDLNDPDTYIYRQSYIPAHSELTVILNNFTYMGELSRMTQYKDKSDAETNISAGLFDYPVLMAADILLYDAFTVPVGEDQSQHLELARDIAVRMNNKFEDDLFTVPNRLQALSQFSPDEKSAAVRIRDLANPEKKMSKSDTSDKGIIFLNDSPEEAHKKIMSATTDSLEKISFDMTNQPGISNLIQLLAKLRGTATLEVAQEYAGQTQYGPLKTAVADEVAGFLVKFQNDLKNVDDTAINEKIIISETAMKSVAAHKLERVQKAVGLR